MRVADGRLFDVQPHPPVRPPEPGPGAEPEDVRGTENDAASQEAALHPGTGERARAAAAAGAIRPGTEPGQGETAERERAARAERAEQERVRREAEEAVRVAAPPAEALVREDLVVPAVAGSARGGSHAGPAVVGESDDRIAAPAAPSEQGATVRDRARVAASAAVDMPSGLPRAASRAALGGVITVAMEFAKLLSTGYWGSNPAQGAAGEFAGAAVLMAIAMLAAVTVAERFVPAVRVPAGSLYRTVGGNRWAATAIQGALAGATVGFLVAGLLIHAWTDGTVLINAAIRLALFTAASFVIAEAVLDRLFRPGPDMPTPE